MSELLEALCHSQTRAREAEKAAQEAYNEKEHVLSLFLRQASQLFAYKQWFHMLQLENLCLQLRNKIQPLLNLIPAALPLQLKNNSRARAGKRKTCRNKKVCGIGKFAVAFAIGLGLAGAGLILGWTMGSLKFSVQLCCAEMAATAEDAQSQWQFSCDLEVDFGHEENASIVYAALAVDKELQPDKVKRVMTVSNGKLCVHFEATEARFLRASFSAFVDVLTLATKTIEEFGPALEL